MIPTRPSFYILKDRKPVPCDLMTWARFFEDTSACIVGVQRVAKYSISTVFLGVDRVRPANAVPLLFETIIFDPEGKVAYAQRSATWENAEQEHREAVTIAKGWAN